LYEELFGRNVPLITTEEQQRIKNLKVAIIGLGALSFVAEYLARLGVQNFVLIDGDKIGPENINHQHYALSDIGKNKAKALLEYLSKVNPETKVIALPIFLDEQNFDEIWNNYLYDADVVIDGIDPVPGIIISKKLAQKCGEEGLYIFILWTLAMEHL
jgi:tRNA A37 threonylcarbamoyladenosine dehydratase